MGDLKKRKAHYRPKTSGGEEVLIENGKMSTDEKTIAELRTYMKEFYKMQIEKQQNQEGEGK